jgi:sulfite reductase (NADPH) hemoprotein beta-component
MRSQAPSPLLKTPVDDFNDVEKAKLNAWQPGVGVVGSLIDEAHNLDQQDITEAAETLAKSHGIYLEYNRAKTGSDKDWMYMIRLSVAGGGPFTRDTWRAIDDISSRYTTTPSGRPSIRLTTRQCIQYHWVKKKDLVPLVRDVAATGFFALNGCGDNTRNVMGCPLSRFSTLYNANAAAQKYAKFFELPNQAHIQIFQIDTSLLRFDGSRVDEPRGEAFEYGPGLLNRKFKIAFSAAHRNPLTGEVEYDNCVELRTNDMGVAPVFEGQKLVAFQVYIGGGQGEKNGKSSASMLGLPVGVFAPENLTKGLDAIVKVHQEWGDRKNRHWARLKYVVNSQGIPWYQDRLREHGATFDQPIPGFDPGPRKLHHGWQTQESNGKLAFGMFVENGRLVDRGGDAVDGSGSTPGNGEQLKSLVRSIMDRFDVGLMITPNQDLLFTDIEPSQKAEFEAALHDKRFAYGTRNGKPYSKLRLLSGACVGLPTCRLSYTDSEQFEPELIDQLEDMGYGDVAESIGITGCERQCFRPGTKTIGLVGQGPDMYMLKLGGGEDGRTQGIGLVEGDKLYLRQVPRAQVATLIATLIDVWQAKRIHGEDLGAFNRRVGTTGILEHLRNDPRTSALLVKTAPAVYIPPAEVR